MSRKIITRTVAAIILVILPELIEVEVDLDVQIDFEISIVPNLIVAQGRGDPTPKDPAHA